MGWSFLETLVLSLWMLSLFIFSLFIFSLFIFVQCSHTSRSCLFMNKCQLLFSDTNLNYERLIFFFKVVAQKLKFFFPYWLKLVACLFFFEEYNWYFVVKMIWLVMFIICSYTVVFGKITLEPFFLHVEW